MISLLIIMSWHLIYVCFRYSSSALSVLKMEIEWLGLTSLKQIGTGKALIAFNPQLCFADTLNLTGIFLNSDTQKYEIYSNGDTALCGK